MNDKLDMSLDEIIKMDGIKGARRNFGNNRNNFGNNRNNFGNNRNNFGNRGRQMNRRNMFNNRRQFGSSGNFSKRLNGVQNRPMNSRDFRLQPSDSFRNRSAKLHISNLATTVNSDDIEELFSTFGTLIRAFVHYDQHGNSLETAEVVFEQRDDAVDARNKLNSVPLDGKPLNIVILNDNSGSDPFTARLRSTNQGSNNRRNFSNRNRKSFDNSQQNRRNRNNDTRPVPSADDLDRELDEYRRQAENDHDFEDPMDE